MDFLEAIILGLIQGMTEFLPVSSSGHLLLTQRLMNVDQKTFGLTFDVALHIGTLLALLFHFRQDLLALPRAVLAPRPPRAVATPVVVGAGAVGFTVNTTGQPEPAPVDSQSNALTVRLGWLILLGCIPAVVIGFLFGDVIEQNVRDPLVVAATLTIFGILMLVADRTGRKTDKLNQLTWVHSLTIGLAQAVALVPGVSRSGVTMTTALFLGFGREEAARFSFLLAIPIVAGAVAKESLKIFKEGFVGNQALLFPLGIAVAAISGYVALRFLVRFLGNFSLAAFCYYRFGLALVVVLIFTVFR